jgi:Uma2 family endonuclease
METGINDRNTSYVGHPPLILHLRPVIDLTDDQLYEFSQLNRDLRIERNAKGELIIMPPTGGDTGERNAEITMQLRLWAKRDGTGTTFDSSTGFRLPNGAVRSPDASWSKQARLVALTAEARKKFVPVCPDFMIELRSATDSLTVLQDKMQEYIENGTQLAWLLDPEHRKVYLYSTQASIKELDNPATISGDPVLPGFVLDLNEVW